MNFAFVKKQFAFAERLVVPRAAGHVLRDVGVDQKRAAGLEVHIGVADVGLAFTQRFHFGAVKNEAGLEFFEDVIIVGSRPVLRDDLFAGTFGLLTFRLLGVLGRLGHNLSLPDDTSNTDVRNSCPVWLARSQLPVMCWRKGCGTGTWDSVTSGKSKWTRLAGPTIPMLDCKSK